MYIDLSKVKRGVVAGALLFGFQAANAAPLELTAIEPDISTSGANINYVYTEICSGISGNGDSGTGECNTTNGLNGKNQIEYTTSEIGLSSGQLTISGSGNFFTVMDDGGVDTGYLTGGTYSLIADFNGDGTFSSGTIGINYSGTFNLSGAGIGAGFDGGPAVNGTLTDFGFSTTAGASGSFEFLFDPTAGDDFYDNLLVQLNAVSIATSFDLVGYDANFQQDFSGTANIDTAVPVPAAVWLFGSGLLGLVGLARRKMGVVDRAA